MRQLIADFDLVGFHTALVDPVPGLIDAAVVAFLNSSIRYEQAEAWIGGLGHCNGIADDPCDRGFVSIQRYAGQLANLGLFQVIGPTDARI